MIVGVLVTHLHVPGSQSLKDKRQVVCRIKERIKNRFNVSIAETDGQNTWQSCELSLAMVAGSESAIDREFQHVMDYVESVHEIEVHESWTDFLK